MMEDDHACKEDMMIVTKQAMDEHCGAFYSQEDKISLIEVGRKIAQYECFLQKFEQWCSEYILY